MRAYLKNYRQAPRKVRLVADMVRGKRVKDALDMLSFTTKRAAPQLKKLILSAIANAKDRGVSDPENLHIKEIRVDKGFTFVRYHPGYGGRATPIHRESSHVALTLGEKSERKEKKPASTDPSRRSEAEADVSQGGEKVKIAAKA